MATVGDTILRTGDRTKELSFHAHDDGVKGRRLRHDIHRRNIPQRRLELESR
jgi:hypothetical protein